MAISIFHFISSIHNNTCIFREKYTWIAITGWTVALQDVVVKGEQSPQQTMSAE